MDLPESVDNNELLGRYLTSRSHFNKTDVLPAAFSPPPDLKLSVVRIAGLSVQEIWQLGQSEVINRMKDKDKRTLYGIGKTKAEDYRSQKLSIIPDNDPFYRHTSITDWPEKAAWLSITQELAAVTTLVLKS
jgi:hypothetical protein